MKFSVLMSVYQSEQPPFLEECFQSLSDQTLLADEIVLVKDGLLPEELETVIDKWIQFLPIKIISYEKNMGLGYALNIGLKACSYEIVARMDTDDIALPKRFEKQIEFLKSNNEVVLFGGQIEEFSNGDSVIKNVPCQEDEILKFLKKRNAFNHMTVMFKKSVILEAENYVDFKGFEDYYLWVRVCHSGFKVANLSDVLVRARVDNDMVGRRLGLQYAIKEYTFLKAIKKIGFINNFEFIRNILFRIPLRFFPKRLLCFVYKILRDK